MQDSNLRGRFAAASFDSYLPVNAAAQAVRDDARAFADAVAHGKHRGGGLFLIGPVGVGKSHLGAAMVRHVIQASPKPAGAAMASVRQVVRALRSTWVRDSKRTEGEVIADLAGHRLLVLDEVGVGFGSDGELVQLFDVIDARYQLQHPTVVLSNLALPDIRSAVGDRIFDRLQEGARTLVMQWPSYRRGPA